MRTSLLTLLFLSVFSVRGISQSIVSDFLLLQHSPTASLSNKRPVSLYEKTIKAQLATTCVYQMSCKEFNKGLFKEFGPLKAFFLSIDRAGRCTHISSLETLPPRLNASGKIEENPKDYRLHQ